MVLSFSLIHYQDKMTQYNSVNFKLSDSELDSLKKAPENATGVNLTLSLDMIRNANGTSFPHILLTGR